MSKSSSCYIYFHFPFDIGFKLGKHIKLLDSIINNKLKNENLDVSAYIEENIEILKPGYLKFIKRDFNIVTDTIFIDLDKLWHNYSFSNQNFDFSLCASHIRIFDTGIGIGSLKFKIDFRGNLKSKGVYDAFRILYSLLSPLEEEESKRSKCHRITATFDKIITLIYDTSNSFEESLKIDIEQRKKEPILYIYPLFYIQDIHNSDQLKEFCCLLFLRPYSHQVSDRKLKQIASSETILFDGEYFIPFWDAALAAGDIIDDKMVDSYQTYLEISSYIYNSMFILESHLSDQIHFLSTNQTVTHGQILDRLSIIKTMRIEINNVQDLYNRVMVSLWAGAIDTFNRILFDAWNFRRLQKSLEEKISLLDFINQSIIDDREKEMNHSIDKALYLFQRMAIPLALVIAILPFLPTSLIMSNMHFQGIDGKWLLLLDAIILTLITLIASYLIDKQRLSRLEKKINIGKKIFRR
jgi:hypothetical protein